MPARLSMLFSVEPFRSVSLDPLTNGVSGVLRSAFGRFTLEVRRGYHNWLLFIDDPELGLLPVSFWRSALLGDPEDRSPSFDRDCDFLADHLHELDQCRLDLLGPLRKCGEDYEREMRTRFGMD